LRDDLDNISTIDSQPAGSTPPLVNSTFTEFKPLSLNDIVKLVHSAKATTCELDIIPTSKLKKYFTVIAPSVTEIVNR
jgi:hypothetical protein